MPKLRAPLHARKEQMRSVLFEKKKVQPDEINLKLNMCERNRKGIIVIVRRYE